MKPIGHSHPNASTEFVHIRFSTEQKMDKDECPKICLIRWSRSSLVRAALAISTWKEGRETVFRALKVYGYNFMVSHLQDCHSLLLNVHFLQCFSLVRSVVSLDVYYPVWRSIHHIWFQMWKTPTRQISGSQLRSFLGSQKVCPFLRLHPCFVCCIGIHVRVLPLETPYLVLSRNTSS